MLQMGKMVIKRIAKKAVEEGAETSLAQLK